MTIATTLPHGLATSQLDSQWNAEYEANLALLDPDRITSGLLAARPAAGNARRFFYATDLNKLYYDDGAAWTEFGAGAALHAASHAAGGNDAIAIAQTQVSNLTADLASKAAAAHGHAGVYEPASANIQSHIASAANPHGVTAAQAGAVALAGNETIGGVKTFASNPVFKFGIRDRFRALLVRNNPAAPASKMDFSFEEGMLQDAGGNAVRTAAAAPVTMDRAITGANGLAAGDSVAASKWFYLWAIWNGTAVAGLMSREDQSGLSPTLPGGYTHKAFMGAVCNDSGGNFINIIQRDNECHTDGGFGSSAGRYLSAGTAAAYTLLTPAVPATAGIAYTRLIAGAAADLWYFSLDGINGTHQLGVGFNTGSSDARFAFWMPLNVNRQHYYRRGGGTAGTLTLDVLGWRF